MTDKKIPLYLVTGFLGAGKTTLMNNILKMNLWAKVGLIVNDFGTVNIDKTLITSNEDIISTDVSGGQIFCACVSGNFVDSMVRLSQMPVDALIVETSGLAKPTPLKEIIYWSQEKSNEAFDYRGMICVVDALNFSVLSKAVNAVDEQIVYSNMFIVNKCDLAEDTALNAIDSRLSELNPTGRIIHTVQAKINPELIHDFHNEKTWKQEAEADKRFEGWGEDGRPFARFLTQNKPVGSKALYGFLKEVSPDLYRIKGYIQTKDKGNVFVDCVGNQIEQKVSDKRFQNAGLMCIAKSPEMITKLSFFWEEYTDTPAEIEQI